MRNRFALIGILAVFVLAAIVGFSGDGLLPPVAPETPGEEEGRDEKSLVTTDHDSLPAAAISGRVLTSEREPAVGLTVRVVQGGRSLPEVTTGPAGWFEVRGLEPYAEVLLTVEGDGSPIPVLNLEPRENRRITVLLPGGEAEIVEVFDTGNLPIQGAEVCVYRCAEPSERISWSWGLRAPPPAVHRRTTAADGLATLPPLGDGSWVIVARHEGYATGFRQIGIFRRWAVFGDEISIRLHPRAVLSGRVTDLAGRPLASIIVCCRARRGNWGLRASLPLLPSARTDRNGEYHLDDVPAGRMTIMAIRPGGSPRDVGIVHLPLIDRFDFSLSVAGVLCGRITDQKTGAPISGARIVAEEGTFSDDGPFYGSETLSDSDGLYEIRGMPVGGVSQLRVNRDGFIPFEVGLSAALLMVEGAPAVYDVELAPGATIEGVVSGPDGPVPGVLIDFGGTETEWKEGRTIPAGIDGRFRITTLDAGRWKVTARATGFGSDSKVVLAKSGGAVSVTISLTPEEPPVREEFYEPTRGNEGTVIVIRGRVRTEDGIDPAGARVEVREDSPYFSRGEGPFRWIPAGQSLDVDGCFKSEITLWKPGGSVTIRAGAPGYAPSEPLRIEMEKGRTEYGVEVVLTRGHTLSARVTEEATGRPIAGARASLLVHERGWSGVIRFSETPPTVVHGVSDRDGRIEIPNVPAGTYGLCVHSVGLLGLAQAVRVPQGEPARILLAPALCLGGVVRYPDGSSPGPVSIRVRPEGDGEARSLRSAADGTFFLRGLKAGRYQVEIHRIIGHGPLNFLEKKAGVFEAGRTDLLIEVERGLRLMGLIRSEEGDTLSHLFVKVKVSHDQRKRIGDSQMVGEDGRFEVVGLPAGEYTVEIEVRGYAKFRRKGVRAGSEDLEFVLSRGWSLSGVLVDEDGKPVVNCGLAAMNPESRSRPDWENPQGGTGAHGEFTITGLEEEVYEIRPSFRSKIPSEPVNLEHGFVLLGETTFAAGNSGLRLVASAGAAISGRVVDEDGDPIERAKVNLSQQESWRDTSTRTDEEGRFKIDHLHPKRTYTVKVESKGRLVTVIEEVHPPRDLSVTVRAGLAITGRALSASGEPLRNHELTFWPSGDSRWHDAETDNEGLFRITGLPAGTYHVFARSPGAEDSLSLGEVKAGAENVVLRPSR